MYACIGTCILLCNLLQYHINEAKQRQLPVVSGIRPGTPLSRHRRRQLVSSNPTPFAWDGMCFSWGRLLLLALIYTCVPAMLRRLPRLWRRWLLLLVPSSGAPCCVVPPLRLMVFYRLVLLLPTALAATACLAATALELDSSSTLWHSNRPALILHYCKGGSETGQRPSHVQGCIAEGC